MSPCSEIAVFIAILAWTAAGASVIAYALWSLLTAQGIDSGFALLWAVLTAIAVSAKVGDVLREQMWLLKKLWVGTPAQRRRKVLSFWMHSRGILLPALMQSTILILYYALSLYLMGELLSRAGLSRHISYSFYWVASTVVLASLLRILRKSYALSDKVLYILEDEGELSCGDKCSLVHLLFDTSKKSDSI